MEESIRKILMEVYGKVDESRVVKQSKNTRNGFTLAKLLTKYSFEEARIRFINKIEGDRKKGTLNGYIERHGEDIGTKKYLEKNSKLSVGTETLKRKGHSVKDIERIKDNHSKKSVNSKENFILRHGEEIGIGLYGEYEKTFKNRTCWRPEFWILRGYTKDEASKLVTKCQIRDFDYFSERGWTAKEYEDYCVKKTSSITLAGYIEKYGEVDGRAKKLYDLRKSNSKSFYIEKYGEVEGTKKYDKMLKGKVLRDNLHSSKEQIEFSKRLVESLPPEFQSKVYGDPYKKGFWIHFKTPEFGINAIVPDLRLYNILIEYDGYFWHKTDNVKLRDKKKDILTGRLGYTTIRVPSEDYMKDRDGTIQAVVKNILDNINLNFKHTSKENQ